MSAFRKAVFPRGIQVRGTRAHRPRLPIRSLVATALAGLLATAGCSSPSPENQGSGGPSATSPAASESSAGAGSAAQCPPLSATVPTDNPAGGTFTASDPDSSALTRADGGTSAVANATVTKSGASSNVDSSSFDGLNAAVLVSNGSRLSLNNATVNTSGTGANAVFSTGTGSLIELANTTVNTDGSFAHAVEATAGGAVTGSDLTLTTARDHSSTIATDRGGGEITINRATATAAGDLSAAVYSTGDISVCGVIGTSRAAEGAVVEGANTLISTGSELTGATHGAYLYSSTPGGSGGGSLTVSGGSLTGQNGNAVLIEGVPGTVAISDGAKLSAGSEALIAATSGGAGTVNVAETELDGNLTADPDSSLVVSLTSNSTVSGALSNVGISLDTTSRVLLQADSTATTVEGALIAGREISNITGNGHTLTYDPSAAENAYLDGGTYTLVQGGSLAPQ